MEEKNEVKQVIAEELTKILTNPTTVATLARLVNATETEVREFFAAREIA